MVVLGSGFWGRGLGLGFWGWVFQLVRFGACCVLPSYFFGVGSLYITIDESPLGKNYALRICLHILIHISDKGPSKHISINGKRLDMTLYWMRSMVGCANLKPKCQFLRYIRTAFFFFHPKVSLFIIITSSLLRYPKFFIS